MSSEIILYINWIIIFCWLFCWINIFFHAWLSWKKRYYEQNYAFIYFEFLFFIVFKINTIKNVWIFHARFFSYKDIIKLLTYIWTCTTKQKSYLQYFFVIHGLCYYINNLFLFKIFDKRDWLNFSFYILCIDLWYIDLLNFNSWISILVVLYVWK